MVIRGRDDKALVKKLAHVRVIVVALLHHHFLLHSFLILRFLPLLLQHEQARVILLAALLLVMVSIMLVIPLVLSYKEFQIVFYLFFFAVVQTAKQVVLSKWVFKHGRFDLVEGLSLISVMVTVE